MPTTQVQDVELSYLDRFEGGWGYRIDGTEWATCAQLAGFTPRSDSAEHLQEAVVSIAAAFGLVIREDQVAVDHLNAYYHTSYPGSRTDAISR